MPWRPNAGLAIQLRPTQFSTMTLSLPEGPASALTPESAALHLAIGLYVSNEVTLGQAAGIAGQTQGAFMRELGKRRIPLNYGPDDLAADLRAVEELARR